MDNVNLDHLYQLASRSYANISFDEQGAAKRLLVGLSKQLTDDFELFRKTANGRLAEPELHAVMDRYQSRYEALVRDWLQSQSRTASSFVVGPARFPVQRMKKLNRWADNKYEYFKEWRERAIKAIVKSLKPPSNELDEARKKLEDNQQYHKMMLAANQIIRKGGDGMEEELLRIGFRKEELSEILKPAYSYKPGFPGYSLQYSNAEIKRLTQRIAVLEAKEQMANSVGSKTEDINGYKLVVNYKDDRVQIRFDEKPDKEVTQLLNKKNFKYKPSEKMWQRKITNAAIYDGREILTKLPGKKR